MILRFFVSFLIFTASWVTLAQAQDVLRMTVYAPPSVLGNSIEEDFLAAEEWSSIGIVPEIRTSPEPPYWIALQENLVDIAYVPAILAQQQAINSVGFTDLLAQPYGGVGPDLSALTAEGPLRNFVLAELEHEDAYALGFASLGASSLVANSPIDAFQEIDGNRWALTGPLGQSFATLGVTSQVLPQADMSPALTAGSVDAVELLFPEDVDRITSDRRDLSVFTGFQPIVLTAFARSEFWEALSEDQRLGIEAVVSRLELQSIARASEAADVLVRTLNERAVAQVTPFGEVLDPTLSDDLREAWSERVEGRQQVLQLFEAMVEQDPTDGETTPRPQRLPMDRGDLFERKIWFATDRVLFDTPEGIERTFGIKFSPQEEASYHCGAISWSDDATRNFGDPIHYGLQIDGQILHSGACEKLFTGLASEAGSEALLFIHGYNNKFHTAAARAAALREDLGWSAPVFLWSWPSRGYEGAYKKDGKAIESSRWRLIPFLRLLKKADFERVDLVTHSMGGRLGTEILAFAGSEKPSPFVRAIFVAPDVSTMDFASAVSTSNFPGKITLYANAHDRALLYSMILNEESRAGLAGDYSLMMKGLEAVDASEIDAEPLPDLNHAHAFDVLEGLTDLHSRLSSDAPAPGFRNLRREPRIGDPHRWAIVPGSSLPASDE